jgi:hypothetical protein
MNGLDEERCGVKKTLARPGQTLKLTKAVDAGREARPAARGGACAPAKAFSQPCKKAAGKGLLRFSQMEPIPRRERLSQKWPVVYRDRPRGSQLNFQRGPAGNKSDGKSAPGRPPGGAAPGRRHPRNPLPSSDLKTHEGARGKNQ